MRSLKREARKQLVFIFVVIVFSAQASRGAEIHVAVTSNFTHPLNEIAQVFSKETGHRVRVSSSSTGRLYTQIRNGAPFDIFLSADRKTPKLLLEQGRAVKGTEFTYATGKLGLWSTKSGFIDKNGETLRSLKFRGLAMANPKFAPYGVAAQETLRKLGLWDQVQPKLVFGENIAQAFQFVSSQNAELGFVALSQIQINRDGALGSYWIVPRSFYTSLDQDAVLLSRAEKSAPARALLDFLKSDVAKKIIQTSGYDLPAANEDIR